MYILDTATGEWSDGEPMLYKRVYASACAMGDRIYVLGGVTALRSFADYTQNIPGLEWDYDHVCALLVHKSASCSMRCIRWSRRGKKRMFDDKFARRTLQTWAWIIIVCVPCYVQDMCVCMRCDVFCVRFWYVPEHDAG